MSAFTGDFLGADKEGSRSAGKCGHIQVLITGEQGRQGNQVSANTSGNRTTGKRLKTGDITEMNNFQINVCQRPDLHPVGVLIHQGTEN